jgi:shikimate kinase
MKLCIFLIGYRGAGKTTVGQIVARKLSRHFADTDAWIETQSGKSIRAIFAEDGEPRFRQWETEALQNLIEMHPNSVIATGGGLPVRESNRMYLRTHGFVCWLDADARTLWLRIQGDANSQTQRPNLAGGGFSEVETICNARRPIYAATSHAKFDVATALPEETADAILNAWMVYCSSS